MTIGLLAALALQTLPSPDLDRWRELAARGEQQFAVDPQSVTRSGTRVSVLVRARTRDAEGPAVGVVRYSYDCAANSVTRETGDVYDGGGHFLGTIDTPQPSHIIPPGSIHATLRDELCGAQTQ